MAVLHKANFLYRRHNSMATTNQNIFKGGKKVNSFLLIISIINHHQLLYLFFKGTSPNHPRGSQPCILGSTFSTQVLSIPFKFSMVLSSFPKSSITADTAFRKDLTLQGCTNVCHAYRPAHYLRISSLPWKAGWVGAVSTSPSLRTFQDHQWR